MENVGRLGGPGGDGALARGDEEPALAAAAEMVVGAEQGAGALGGLLVEGIGSLDEIDFDGVDRRDVVLGNCVVKRGSKRLEAKIRESGKALK